MERKGLEYTEVNKDNTDVQNLDKGKDAHEMSFIEENKQLFENFLGGSFCVEQSKEGTFYFNLKSNTVGISDVFYKQKGLEWSREATVFAILHELGHFEEKFQMLNEKDGEISFEKYLQKIKNDRAFGMLNNCVADNRENRNVILKTNNSFRDIERKMYKDILFSEKDFTNKPRHVQLSYALIREGRLPDEKCVVDKDVREALDRIFSMKTKSGNSMFELLTNPKLPMSKRLILQEAIIVPEMEKLKEQDLEDKEKEQKDNEQGDKGDKKQDKQQKGDKSSQTEESNEQGEQEENGDQNKKGQNGDRSEKLDPNAVFKEDYDEFDKKFGEQITPEDAKKILEEHKKISTEEKKKNKDNPIKKANEEYAKNLGVSEMDLNSYRNLAKKINDLQNPKTGKLLVDEMEDLFHKIISKREKATWLPKMPTDEGEYLIDPAMVITEVKKGNFEPEAWESVDLKEKKGEHFGEIEITLVCDCSGSMQGERNEQQLKATVLLMETIKRFIEMVDGDRDNLTDALKISSEIYSFGKYGQNYKPIKEMSNDFTEKERIEVSKIVSNTNGPDNNEHEIFKKIEENILSETKEKIEDGVLKKILIIFSDGIADDVLAVKEQIAKIRKGGVITIGVGITEDGESALTTYAPNARLARSVNDLCPILTELLQEHLRDI